MPVDDGQHHRATQMLEGINTGQCDKMLPSKEHYTLPSLPPPPLLELLEVRLLSHRATPPGDHLSRWQVTPSLLPSAGNEWIELSDHDGCGLSRRLPLSYMAVSVHVFWHICEFCLVLCL